jgi:cell division protein FtsN
LETPEAARLDVPPVDVQDLPPRPNPAGAEDMALQTRAAAPPHAGTGFRVQVFATTDAAAAERVRAGVAARFTEKVSVDYEAPYHKVRVGSCSSSDACRDLQERLRAAGYATVWIVPGTAAVP